MASKSLYCIKSKILCMNLFINPRDIKVAAYKLNQKDFHSRDEFKNLSANAVVVRACNKTP